MRLSVVVPVYMTEEYLPECIESIIDQHFKKLEIILVDDGSRDNCGKICDEYASRDRRIVVIHQLNSGLSAARNAGIEIAKGDYITFVDSDDLVAPDTYSLNMEILANDIAIDVLQYPVLFEYGSIHENLFFPASRHSCTQEEIYTNLMVFNTNYSACNKIYKKKIFSSLRYPVGRWYEDALAMPHIIDLNPHWYISTHGLYYYRYRKTSFIRKQKQYSEWVDLFEALCGILDNVRKYESLGKYYAGMHTKITIAYMNIRAYGNLGASKQYSKRILDYRYPSFHEIFVSEYSLKGKSRLLVVKIFGILMLSELYSLLIYMRVMDEWKR